MIPGVGALGSLGWLVWWLGCGAPTVVPEPAADDHAAAWPALVAAADRGDLATLRVHARDLRLGTVDDDPEAARVGAALGFLQLVDDPADVPDAVAKARAACVACHDARGVVAPVD
ncbi:MAG: hypothetical protein ABMB14_04950 [Myxococcota bacterium]